MSSPPGAAEEILGPAGASLLKKGRVAGTAERDIGAAAAYCSRGRCSGVDPPAGAGLSQARAPLFESLVAHTGRRAARFHVPGHKGGRGPFREMALALGRRGFEFDLTEVGNLDDLHCPSTDGPLEEAQRLAAEAYGAAEARFLAAGATTGILAMVLAAVPPGRTLMVTVPYHRSVVAAAVLAGCRLSFVPPRLGGLSGRPVPASSDVVALSLQRERPAALLVTSPTYEGFSAELTPLAEACARARVPLLVDAAHGAHFGFSSCLPPTPVVSGVSACVVSLHKTAGALTPGAILLIGRRTAAGPGGPAAPPLEDGRLAAAVRLVHTTSPSHQVLASLDLARRRLVLAGEQDWSAAAERSEEVRECVRRAGGWLVPFAPPEDGLTDPTRIVFEVEPSAHPDLTGLDVGAAAARRGVDLELAGWGHVVAVAGPADTPRDCRRLARALVEGTRLEGADTGGGPAAPGERPRREWALSLEKECLLAGCEVVLPPGEAFRRPRRRVPVTRSVGRIAADVVSPYPPGVPLVLPGQRMTQSVVRYLDLLARSGVRVHGMSDGGVEVLA